MSFTAEDREKLRNLPHGESLYFPAADLADARRIRSGAHSLTKSCPGWRFVTRQEGTGIRVYCQEGESRTPLVSRYAKLHDLRPGESTWLLCESLADERRVRVSVAGISDQREGVTLSAKKERPGLRVFCFSSDVSAEEIQKAKTGRRNAGEEKWDPIYALSPGERVWIPADDDIERTRVRSVVGYLARSRGWGMSCKKGDGGKGYWVGRDWRPRRVLGSRAYPGIEYLVVGEEKNVPLPGANGEGTPPGSFAHARAKRIIQQWARYHGRRFRFLARKDTRETVYVRRIE